VIWLLRTFDNTFIPDYCFGDNDKFARLEKNSSLAFIRKDAGFKALDRMVEDPEAVLAKADLVKDSRSTKAGITEFEGRKIFIKRYNNKGIKYSLKYLFREARPLRCWRAAWLLENLEIPTPKPLAAIVCRNNGFLSSAYIINEYIEENIPALEYHDRLVEDKNFLAEFSKELMGYLATLHSNGIYHGDLKLSNVYCIPNSTKGSFGFWDLDGMKILAGALPEKVRNMELARLASSYVEIGRRKSLDLDLNATIELFLTDYNQLGDCRLTVDAVLDKTKKFFKEK
jgi:tRNA A-37 threonylcarbamoyl transferase component Bud32